MTLRNESIQIPLVSVIIRTKDRPVLLCEALNSVKEQTYKNIEIVIVNDGGNDINEIIDRYASFFCGFQYVFIKENKGRSVAANRGLEASTGECLIFLDDDDLYEPEHLEHLVRTLKNQQTAKVVYSGTKLVNGDKETVLNHPFSRESLCLGNFIPIHAALFDRSLLENGCRFDETFNVYEDWDFWLQLSVHTSFLYCDKITAIYRNHGDSEISPLRAVEGNSIDGYRSMIFEKWRQNWDGHQINRILFEASSVKSQHVKNAEKQYEAKIEELRRVRDHLTQKAERFKKSVRQLDHTIENLKKNEYEISYDKNVLKSENDSLKSGNDVLKSENDVLKSENDVLKSENDV